MGNLFAKAASKAETKTTKEKDKKVRIPISDPTFFDNIAKLEIIQDRMKSDKAKADMISDEIKDLGKAAYADLYNRTGRNPGSVMLEAVNGENTAQAMFLPSDKYITITPERAEVLKGEFGDEIVEEKISFAFDNEMVEKYGEIISDLIENSNIPDVDKGKIIKAVAAYSIAKGTIDKLKDYGNVSEVMEAVKPVISLKNVSIIKS